MFERKLGLREILRHRSVLLLGPRQTGKSTLLRQQFPEARTFDLLEADTFRELSVRPESMRQMLRPSDSLVVVDDHHHVLGIVHLHDLWGTEMV